MTTNQDIARIFYEIADLLEMQGVPWEPNAYRRAARSIESMADDIGVIHSVGGLKALMRIPGVGQGISKAIEEYLKKGRIDKYEKLKKTVPAGVEEMLHIQGLGPKKVKKLYDTLKVKSIAELQKAIKAGKVEKMEGFGKKTAENILSGITLVKAGMQRALLGVAWPLSQQIIDSLSGIRGVRAIEACGSLRRRKETIGDIDILAIAADPTAIMKRFTELQNVQRVLAKGPTRSAVVLKEGVNADLRVLDERSFGAALQYFTGSKEHNVATRQIAIKKGYKLNEYGLFDKKTGKQVAGRDEKEIYRKLGLEYIEPELRENSGEIEAAMRKTLPALIPYGSLRGDLHMHTAWSDGIHATEMMVNAAIERGYDYIAITDHSKSQRIANGLDEKRLAAHIKEIEALRKKHRGIHIFTGSEVDILPDGSLDYDDRTLEKLDVVIASVHSGFKMGRDAMTERVITALSNPHVTVLGHPTGRLINQRNPFDIDMDAVFRAAKKNGVALEINSHPSRLDLNDAHIKAAVGAGCTLAINTDSHATDHLRYAEFGIATARRGWAEAKNVLNTKTLSAIEKFIER